MQALFGESLAKRMARASLVSASCVSETCSTVPCDLQSSSGMHFAERNAVLPHPARVGRHATQQRRAEMPPSKGGQKCHTARVVPVWLQSRLALSVCLSVCLSVGCLLCYLIGVRPLAMLLNVPQLKINAKLFSLGIPQPNNYVNLLVYTHIYT